LLFHIRFSFSELRFASQCSKAELINAPIYCLADVFCQNKKV
jgi:hypothetical protein